MDSVLKKRNILQINMSSKYVAPAMRKREPVAPPIPPPEKKFEDEFPTLVPAQTSHRVWGGTSTFAEKAREWKEQADTQKEENKVALEVELDRASSINRVLPKFHNIRRFVETDEAESHAQPEAVKPSNAQDDESGWILVERKLRKKQKTLTEIADEDFAKASDEEHDDSVWNEDKQLHETCWEENA